MCRRILILVLLISTLISSKYFSQTTSGLIGYWPFNGDALDVSGFNNHGVIHFATLTADRFSNPNSAYYFSGNSYISCSNITPQAYNQLTLSVWIKTNLNAVNPGIIVGKYIGPGSRGGFLLLLASSAVMFDWQDAQITSYGFGGQPGLCTDNKWHHIVAIVSNPTNSVWIDGVQTISNTKAWDVDVSQQGNLYFGGLFSNSGVDQNEYYTGAIDDIRIYNRALSSSEIQALYHENGWANITTYNITTSANPAIGGTITGGGNYNSGSTVSVIASASTGYSFLNWTENGSVVSTNPTYTFTATINRNLVANFILKTQYTVSTSCYPLSGGTTNGSGIYYNNTSVQVIAAPSTNYKFIYWTENSAVVSTSAAYSFTITSDRNLVANFNQTSCTITTSSNPVSGGNTSGGGTYDMGTNALVIASPSSGYSFIDWTENGSEVSTNLYYSFTAYGNRTLVANFVTIPNLSVSPAYMGVAANSGTSSFYVTNTTGGSMNWNAVSNSSWITITNGSNGTNNGAINVNYQANSGAYRVGTITITTTGMATSSPQTVEVRQSAFVGIDKLNGIPTDFVLFQNYPNPFNPATKIQFGVPRESYVFLKVYDLLGNEVSTLVNETIPTGTYSVNFDASKLDNGIYFYRIQAGEFSQTKKMILLK